LIAIPAMALLMILPLSISGWGIRETSVAAILGLWGIDASLVILASIFYGLLTIVNYLPGAYQLMLRKNEHLS
jgi:ABC-type proline/glycine betaine transport system permease subunit